MVKLSFLVGSVLLLLLVAHPLIADDSATETPWEKFSFNVGAFMANSNTDLRFGSGVGVSVNVEEALGMDAENRVFRMEGYWRFTDNRRHRLGLSWFSFNRTGTKTVGEAIVIEPPEGDDITIPIGTEVESFFDLDIFQLDYSYSFIQDNRLDLAGQFGLYVMPMNFGISATGLVDEEGTQNFMAPLPVIGLKLDVLLAPKWYFRTGSQIFYLKYENFTGSLINLRSAVEYNPWKHVGFGLGIDAMRMGLQADGVGDYPGIDLKGNVQFDYTGVMLYGRVFF
ncbi:MAG: hypothetical protein DRI24_00140 [Deltaproteobacteria bacterium]|nr:MAG: hypothetical protein DRI24_00140 [Deltaproteobacteria bacterium]